MTDDERRMRHKMIYGEGAEPPAERTGRNAPDEDRGGRPFGVPRTEPERRARHKELHGEGTEPPAERIGRNPMPAARPGYYPVIIGEEGGATRVVYTKQGELPDISDSLWVMAAVKGGWNAGVALLSWIRARKMIQVALIAGTSLVFGGLKGVQLLAEQRKRKGLLPFQLVIAEPKEEEINDPDATYVLTVLGAVPERKVKIKFGKAGTLKKMADPVFRENYGDFVVHITARELADAAQKSKFLVGRIPGLRESGDVTVYMYAQEDRKRMLDLESPITPVKVHIPSMAERAITDVTSGVPCLKPPKSISVEDANMGYAIGTPYFIKSSLPIFCCLPGLPYMPGMWVPPMCVISETA
jgi:hypothetical protein